MSRSTQPSVTGLLLTLIKGPPCHYHRPVTWRFPDVNMGVSVLAWWELSSSDHREGQMFKLLLPWEQRFVSRGSSHTVFESSSCCGKNDVKNKCYWSTETTGNSHVYQICLHTHTHTRLHTYTHMHICHVIHHHLMLRPRILFSWSCIRPVSKSAAERKYWFRN